MNGKALKAKNGKKVDFCGVVVCDHADGRV